MSKKEMEEKEKQKEEKIKKKAEEKHIEKDIEKKIKNIIHLCNIFNHFIVYNEIRFK